MATLPLPSTPFQSPNANFHAPLANGTDTGVPPMFGGTGPIQTQGVKTSALGVGKVGRVAKARN
jgi:hypothetical protein